MQLYNPWIGCKKKSAGCRNCFAEYFQRGTDFSEIRKTKEFDAILNYPPGTHSMVALMSDFFLPDLRGWREEVFELMRRRPDLKFTIVTKYPECIEEIPPNVQIGVTIENQAALEERREHVLRLPRKVYIFVEPILESFDMSEIIPNVSCVMVCGEIGPEASVARYSDMKRLYDQCARAGVSFTLGIVGSRFEDESEIVHELGFDFEGMAMRAARLNLFVRGEEVPDARMSFPYYDLVEQLGARPERDPSVVAGLRDIRADVWKKI
jgi:protein gp37